MVKVMAWPALLYPYVFHEYESPEPEVLEIAVEAVTLAASVAVPTCELFVVGAPPVVSGGFVAVEGTVHDASVWFSVHRAAAFVMSESLPDEPVSVVSFTNRLVVVFA